MASRATILTVGAMLLCVPELCAQARRNFSGTWKMNMEKSKLSDGNPITYYTEFIQEIDHREPKLQITEKIKSSDGDRNVVWKLDIDGREYDAKVVDVPAKISANWDGDRLITRISGEDWKVVRKSKMAEDGKAITSEFELALDDGSVVKATEIWEKQ